MDGDEIPKQIFEVAGFKSNCATVFNHSSQICILAQPKVARDFLLRLEYHNSPYREPFISYLTLSKLRLKFSGLGFHF